MDTPWLHIYTSHKLSQHQRHMLQLTSELTASKWLVVRNLMLEGFYRDRGREREARLKLYTQAATYVQVRRGCSIWESVHIWLFSFILGFLCVLAPTKRCLHVHCLLIQRLRHTSGRRMGRGGEAKCEGLRLNELLVDSTLERRCLSGDL